MRAITTQAPAAAPGFAAAAKRLLGRGFDLLYAWQVRAEQRHHLSRLDDRLLRDMGLSRADVAQESEKPFWKV